VHIVRENGLETRLVEAQSQTAAPGEEVDERRGVGVHGGPITNQVINPGLAGMSGWPRQHRYCHRTDGGGGKQ
jgi:hypothetical protein